MIRESFRYSVDDIKVYYQQTALGAYERWQAGVGGYHFTFIDNPEISHNVEPEEVKVIHRRAHERMIKEVVNFVNPDKGETVIDNGCGEGGMFQALENRGVKVIATNIVSIHLEKARQRIVDLGLVNVSLLQADFSYLSLEDGVVDKVLFLESLAHSLDKFATLAEACRVLKDDGELIIIGPMLIESRLSLEGKALELTSKVDRGMLLKVLSIPDLIKMFEELNLEVVSLKDITVNTFPSMQLAAASAEAHVGENPSDNVRHHREAAIACRDMVIGGHIQYRLFKTKKKGKV